MMRVVGVSYVIATPSLSALPDALRVLLSQGVNVIGICGGDGTLHHTINALLQLQQADPTSERAPALPSVLLLPGGTLNMLAQAMHVSGDPVSLASSFCQRWSGRPLASLSKRATPLLHMGEGERHRYGWIFGSEITARCLELYEKRFGGGYLGLLRFLRGTTTSFLLNGALWKMYKPLFEGPGLSIELDQIPRRCRAVVASTIDIRLLRGLICGLHVENPQPGTMQVRLLEVQTPAEVFGRLHKLVLGQKGAGIEDVPKVQEIKLPLADYSMDGEIFSPMGTSEEMILRAPKWRLSFVGQAP